ncbi:MAG TPA: hypothetical protein VFT22_34605 [Kofleriaceae bacterium]|nr:hypothetical protein [Kofleriaceae bacterium]
MCGFCAESDAGLSAGVSSESIPVISSISGAWYGSIFGTSTINLPPAWVHAAPVEIAIRSAAARAVVRIEARVHIE